MAPLPGYIDFADGAALVMSGLTAWQGLFDHGRLQSGQSVLVNGAAGVVGSMVIQLARHAGAYVVGTGRSSHRQAALDFGAHEFLDLDSESVKDAGKVDLFFNVLGADELAQSAGAIRSGGTLVTVSGPTMIRPVDGKTIDFIVIPDSSQLNECKFQNYLSRFLQNYLSHLSTPKFRTIVSP